MYTRRSLCIAVIAGFLFFSCKNELRKDNTPQGVEPSAVLTHKSQTLPLITISPEFANVKAYSLLTTPDVIGQSKFQLSGSADGAGFLKTDDGYLYIVNCEDTYSVARVFLDKTLKPLSGDYLLSSGVQDYARQCSATMWEKAIHGGDRDVFLSASEDYHHKVKAIDPWVKTPTPTSVEQLSALGSFHWENAVPLPKNTYTGKTVIIGGDDDYNGQLILYYSEQGKADLTNGKVYVLKAKEISDGQGGKIKAIEDVAANDANFDFQKTYDVEFVEIKEAKHLTLEETQKQCDSLSVIQFTRVEDVDYQKGSDDKAHNVYFSATGAGPNSGTPNEWGVVYRLTLDQNNPLQGKLTPVISGNTDTNNKDGNLPTLQSCDNLCVTEHYIYVQEDPNSLARGHSAYIYQADLDGNNPKKLLELIVDKKLVPKEHQNDSELSCEYGSLIDISDKVGIPDTFLLALQLHYWTDDSFKNLDGHTSDFKENNQASQIVILSGLPR